MHGARVGLLAHLPRELLAQALDAQIEGRHDPHAQHVGDAPEQPLPRAPHEHDPILLGELVERGLEHRDVPSRLGVEALEEGRLGLVQARELLLEESVAERRLGNELLIDVVAAQALGHLLGDLRTARADLVRHGQDGHGRHSFLYLARSAAGAMAMRLPLTSSRT